MQGALRVAQRINTDLFAVEGVLDPGCGFGAIGDGNHHRRNIELVLLPRLRGLTPVVAEQVIAVGHEVGQRLFRSGPPVQVILYLRVVIDVVQTRLIGLGVRHGIVADHNARSFHQAGLNSVVQPKIADDPAEQPLLGAFLAGWRKRCGGKVVAGKEAARRIDAVQAADPFRCFLDIVLGDTPDFGLGRHPPSVVGLVVDDQDIASIRHVAQHFTDIGFVALGSAFIDTPLLGDLLLGFPVERVPVANHDLALAELVEQRRRDNAERLVVVLRVGRLQDRQTALDRQPRRYDQDVGSKPDILRMGDFIQHMPGNDHAHDNGLAGTGRHLGA